MALAGALVFFSLAAVTTLPGVAWTSDEGAYGWQVQALRAGDWAHHPPVAALGLGPDSWAMANGAVSDRGWFPYVKHPVYPLVLTASVALLGSTWGLVVPSVLGALAAAALAVALAGRLGVDRRHRWWALAVAAASPLAMHATVVWAHAPGAAAAGVAVLGAVDAVRGRLLRGAAMLAAGGVVGALLRSELLLWAAACVVGVMAAAPLGRWWRTTLAGLAAAGTVAVAAAAEVMVVRGITGPGSGAMTTVADRSAGSAAGARIDAAVATLIGAELDVGTHGVALFAAAVGMLGLVRLVLVAGRRPLDRHGLVIAGGTAVLTVPLWWRVAGAGTLDGFLTAWPLAVLAVIGAWRSWRSADAAVRASTRAVVVTSTVFVVAVFATQYPEGGGQEWGARFLLPLVPVAAALASGVLGTLVAQVRAAGHDRVALGAVAAGVGVVALAPLALAWVELRDTRGTHREFQATVEERSVGRFVVVTNPHFARIVHGPGDRIAWVGADPDGLEARVDELLVRGHPVLVVEDDAVIPPGLAARAGLAPERDMVGGLRAFTLDP